MTFSLTEIEQQASQLPAGDRAKLAEFLLESLQDPVVSEIEKEWEKEIAQRVEAYENGEISSYPAEAVFAEARRLSQ